MPTRPNLLVILADQLQRDCLACYGGPAATPNFDRLARRAQLFRRAYCANPLCVPTRPSMLSGLYPHRHGSTSFGGPATMRPGIPLLTDRLADAGYRVGYDGLWHVHRAPEDAERGSATFAEFRTESFPYADFARMYTAQGAADGTQRAAVRTPTDEGWHDWTFSLPVPATWIEPIERHVDRRLADRVADELRADAEPFAWWCSFAAPHPPLLVPAEFAGRHDPAGLAPPASFGEPVENQPRAVRDAPGAQAVRDWDWTRWAPCAAAYLDFVTFLDDNLGRLLDRLDETGLNDRTYVLFAADHGECLGAHNLYQKGVAYEESAGIPMFLAGPDLAPAERDDLASQVDFAPTLLELLGLPPLVETHGRSLVGDPAPEAVAVEFGGYIDGGIKWRAMIESRYKYVWYSDGAEQLFDRVADPAELSNLVASPAHTTELERLRTRLADWRRRTGDGGS